MKYECVAKFGKTEIGEQVNCTIMDCFHKVQIFTQMASQLVKSMLIYAGLFLKFYCGFWCVCWHMDWKQSLLDYFSKEHAKENLQDPRSPLSSK